MKKEKQKYWLKQHWHEKFKDYYYLMQKCDDDNKDYVIGCTKDKKTMAKWVRQ